MVEFCKIKKPTIFFICIWLPAISFAQIRYSVSGGVNITDLRNKWEIFDNPRIIPRFGYSVGGGMEIPVKPSFFIKTQLNIVAKNYAFETEDFYGAGTEGYDRYSVLYLDLPVNFGYRYKQFQVFAGPFIDLFLGGTNRHQLTYFNGTTDNARYNIGSSKELSSGENSIFPMRRQYFIDGGFIAGIGFRNDSYNVDFFHSLGIINVFPKLADPGISRKEYPLFTRVFTVQMNIFL